MLRSAALYGLWMLHIIIPEIYSEILSFFWVVSREAEWANINKRKKNKKKEVQQDGFPVLNIMYKII